MAVEVAGISYFAPLLAFLIVFIIVFALLNKTKILGEEKFVQLFVSFLIATIFVSAAGVRDYVLTITPWFAVLVISLFFVLLIMGFVGKQADFMQKGVGITAIIVLVIIFLVSGFIVFSGAILPYLTGGGDNPLINYFIGQGVYSSRVFGALLLLVISAVVSWVLVRQSK